MTQVVVKTSACWRRLRMVSAGCAIALLLVLACGGCEKKKEPVKPTTSASGASTGYYENEKDSGDAQVIRISTVKPPAPKPTGPLPSGSSCITSECHSTMATSKQVHGPVSQGSCVSCHEGDVGGHRYPLKRQGIATCTFCHSVSGTQAHQHDAILKQGCTSCHDPHASKTKFLLVEESVERVCARCHDVPHKKYAHYPFAQGDCTLCHQPHQSEAKGLLRGGEGVAHCESCHGEIKQAMAKSLKVHEPAKSACTTCHEPHATDNPRLLSAPTNQQCIACHKSIEDQLVGATQHGALTTQAGCANCHDPHAAGQPAMLKQSMDKLCLNCHDKELKGTDGHLVANMKPQLTAKYLHGPIRSGTCSPCHDPHGAKEPNLLNQAFPASFYSTFDLKNYALCFNCHDQQLVLAKSTGNLTNFRDGDVNLHFVHVNRDRKGRSCKTCHSLHGSDLPHHMAEAVPFEGSKWPMPIRYAPTADGGSCSPGCHQEKKYSRTGSAVTTPNVATPAKEDKS